MFSANQIFTIPNFIIYLVIINTITFLAMLIDKQKAKRGGYRISEKTLITLVLLGGGIGGIIGMYLFHHKTKKPRFYIGFPVILVLEIIAILYFFLSRGV